MTRLRYQYKNVRKTDRYFSDTRVKYKYIYTNIVLVVVQMHLFIRQLKREKMCCSHSLRFRHAVSCSSYDIIELIYDENNCFFFWEISNKRKSWESSLSVNLFMIIKNITSCIHFMISLKYTIITFFSLLFISVLFCLKIHVT